MAVTAVGAFIVTTQFSVPVHAPDHPVNVDPAAARDRFMERFTLEAVGLQMAELYREIVAGAS